MRIRVIGYNDLAAKPRGEAKRFRPEHCFESGHVPSQDEMRVHCEKYGYPILTGHQHIPGIGHFRSDGRCEPVYEYVEE